MSARAGAGRLAGKRILLTGAGGHLGGDLARAFAAQGAHLLLTTRTAAKLTPLVEELGKAGIQAYAVTADFTCSADIDRLAEAAEALLGGIDVVVLSSQPAEPNQGELLSTPEEAWVAQHQAIAWGPFRLVRALAPGMIARGSGSILALVSSTAEQPVPGYAAYGLAKNTLLGLTRYMAAEWGPFGIRANALCPGMILTGGSGTADPDVPNAVLARTSLARMGRNSEVIGAAVYLASDEASFTTGQLLRVDGGRF